MAKPAVILSGNINKNCLIKQEGKGEFKKKFLLLLTFFSLQIFDHKYSQILIFTKRVTFQFFFIINHSILNIFLGCTDYLNC